MKRSDGRSLVILYEPEHVDIVLAHFGIDALKDGSGPIVVPIDYEIELRLHAKSIPFHSMADYVTRSSLEERARLVSRMMRQLYTDPAFSFFAHNGISLGRIVGYSLGEYLLRVLYDLDIFEFILDRFANAEMIYFPESTMVLPATVGQLATFEIRARVDTMAFLTHKRNIAFRIIPCPLIVATERKGRNHARRRVRSILIQSINVLNGLVSLFRTRSAMRIFVSDYWWHIDSFITMMDKVELTMMERREIQNARAFIWKYKILFNHLSDYSTRAIQRRAEEQRKCYEQAWRELCGRQDFPGQFVWQGVRFWDVVQPAYEHLIASFSGEVVETIEATERLFKMQGIHAVLLRASTSGQIHFATLGLVAHQMGIPSIELQHGLECSADFSISVHKNADILASYGSLIKNELEKVDSVVAQTLAIGSPRFDRYRKEEIGEEAKRVLLKEMHLDAGRSILLYVATDIVLGQTHDTYSMHRLFRDIAAATAHIAGLQVIVKIRPGPAKELFFKGALREAFGERCYIAQYEDLHELISISSIVTSSFSTVTLETMIVGKPLILVGIDKNDRMLMESHFLPYEQAQALRIARTKEELTEYVRTIIVDMDESEKLVRNARNFLKDNFCFDGRSAERMADFLETLRK